MFLPNTMRSSAPVMPSLGHGAGGDFEIGRELVGDGGDCEKCGHESSL